MIDCGIAYNHMKDELYKCRVLFITHKHSDHLKDSTLKRIMKDFPNITIYSNYEVCYLYPNIHICNEGLPIRLKDKVLTPFENKHDVVCYGLAIEFNDGTSCIYATDTYEIKNYLGIKYDYIFLEANYDEDKLKLMNKNTKGYNPAISAQRHLSKKASKTFYYLNRKSKESVYEELHRSERFY